MQEATPDKRSAALNATLELISEQGFHGTPMSQIAQKANIGVGTIYRYFKSKDDLINALYIEVKTQISNYTFRNYSENISVPDSFKQLVGNVICYFVENPKVLSFIEQYENSPLITDTTREEVMRIAEPIKNLFNRARDQGLLKAVPFEILGALFSGAVIALTKLCMANKASLEENSFEEAIDALWDMIKQ